MLKTSGVQWCYTINTKTFKKLVPQSRNWHLHLKAGHFDRVKFFICGQYWNKYDSFVNIEAYALIINENIQEDVLNIMVLCRI